MKPSTIIRNAEKLRDRGLTVEGLAALSKAAVEEFQGQAPERVPQGVDMVLAGLAYSEFLTTTSSAEDLAQASDLQGALFNILGIVPEDFRTVMEGYGWMMAAT